jgi:O-succinylbenzoate synthase
MQIEFEPSEENAKWISEGKVTPERLSKYLNEYCNQVRMYDMLRSAYIGASCRLREMQSMLRSARYYTLKAKVTREPIELPKSLEYYETEAQKAQADVDNIARIASDHFGYAIIARDFSA